MRSVVIGTAGHIDHGKSTLVQAITGTHPSRLAEEKKRGITIDLGFAVRDVSAPDGSSLRLSFVDVPGHSAFIHNMLAGAAGIDLVLLVISAAEGVRPQTREHLSICELLGVKKGLAVLTKTDTVTPERLAEVSDEVRQLLRGSFLDDGSPPVPVSARTAAGIPELLERLIALACEASSRDPEGLLRLPVDRSFALRGFGTVVTGTLSAGTVTVEQKLLIEPGSRSIRVRGLQTHGEHKDCAVAGSRVALNLIGADHASVARGDTIVAPDTFSAVDTIDAEITLLEDAPPLKHGAELMFHVFTFVSPAVVLLYSRSDSKQLTRLKLRQRTVLAPGDRFILRMPSPSATVAGGRVLDANPLLRRPKHEVLRWLEQVRQAGNNLESLLVLRVARRREQGLDVVTACREMALTAIQMGTLIQGAVGAGKLVRIGESVLVERIFFDDALRRVETELHASHAAAPAEEGVRRAELRGRCRLPALLFNSAIDQLVSVSVIKASGDMVAIRGFAAQQNSRDRQVLDSICSLCIRAGLQTPSLHEIAAPLRIAEGEARRLLAILIKEKRLVRIAADAYVDPAQLAQLREKLVAFRGRSFGVIEFKQLTGLSRKHAIPWLEYLDREHITRRTGDTRLVF